MNNYTTFYPLEPRGLNRMRDLALYVSRANSIRRTLGVRRAAGYLRNRGVSVEAAIYILLIAPKQH